uniref:ATPase components of ABC transporters with duplicated ATPase domains n=1 Tax=uncultured bacterium A1Q1_fos_15 TaxID=1256548 RepID=L7VXQ3_9BACT|nr:ATPase components of ABC transporters with duplicated ATPase domains [uncultured bacterium A1Q1_fos_15]
MAAAQFARGTIVRAMILVDASNISMSRPGRPLFSNLSVTINTGDRIGLVGINGCGKSTLMDTLMGRIEPEAGSVRRGKGARIAMLDQNPDLGTGTVRDHLGDHWESAAILDRLGMSDHMDTPVSQLSGGQAKRVALTECLVAEVDLLLLDEPTNHLDLDAIAWLEERLAGYKGGLILVTHDRHVLDRVTNRVIELDRGKAYLHEGGYDTYLQGRADREARAVKAEDARKNLARKELAWLRRGAPARTSKPKAHIERATAIIEAKAEAAARSGELPLHFDTPRLGDIVVELHDIGHEYAETGPLFSKIELLLDPRERLGIVGPNGAGKTTLLQILGGRLAPTSGSVVVGKTARIGYVDQQGTDLDPKLRVWEAVVGPDGTHDWKSKALMEAFWFDEDSQWAPVELLSGGERRRLQLLIVLAQKPNVLFLDEPTNDLDLDTLRALEDFLDEWPGALVVVSHDRAFLERAVADVIVIDGVGKAGRRPGGYAKWEADRHLRRKKGSTASVSSKPSAGTGSAQGGSSGLRSGHGLAPTSSAPGTKSGGPSASTIRHRLKAADKRYKAAKRAHEKLTDATAEAATKGDHEKLTALASQLSHATTELDAAETEWLDLAMQAEEAGLSV